MKWTLDRILDNCEEVGDCLEWQGRMGCGGCKVTPIYKARINGKAVNVPVCREVWELTRGPIPAGRIVYRKCCNDRCVSCLALGVRGDAMRQRKKLGLAAHAPSTRAALTIGARKRSTVKNSIEKAREVRALVADGVKGDERIGALTGVHPDMVAEIRRGDAWRETSHASSVFAWRP